MKGFIEIPDVSTGDFICINVEAIRCFFASKLKDGREGVKVHIGLKEITTSYTYDEVYDSIKVALED